VNASIASFIIELSEAEFQQQVTRLAENLGWHWMHVKTTGKGQHFPIRGTMRAGWPDLFFAKPGRGFFWAELKRDREQLSKDQVRVHELLLSSGAVVYTWRPHDFPLITEILSR